MTVQEFWDSEEKLAIHCDTEEKANKLLKKFRQLGKKWSNGESYKKNYWKNHKEKMCYGNRGYNSSITSYKSLGITIIEFDDLEDFKEPKSFTKNDLKNRMVVELRNKERYLVVDDLLIGVNGFLYKNHFYENLLHINNYPNHEDYDIVKVFAEHKYFGVGFEKNLYEDKFNNLLWERKEEKEPLLTDEEKKKLVIYKENIFKFLTSEQIYIEKTRNDLLKIYSSNIEIWCYGIKNNDLKNLELGKKYTLKELGL